jgi:hypothetical protein
MPVPSSPNVTVLFSGLLILRFDPSNEFCEVGVLRDTPDHRLSIIVREKRGKAPAATIWRQLGNLDDELWLDVQGLSRRVEMYKVDPDTPLHRATPGAGQDQDIRWAIDLSSSEFHNTPSIKIRPEAISPKMYLTKGLFHTALRTDPTSVRSIKRKGGGKPDLELYRIASVIGANIYYDVEGGLAFLQMGGDEDARLELPAKTEYTSYEIIVDNSPLNLNLPREEELKNYYQLIEGISPGRRFEIKAEAEFTPDVPCMTFFFGTGQ